LGFGSLLEIPFHFISKSKIVGVLEYLVIWNEYLQGNGNVASYDPTGAMIMDG
jgi:hypothetical protein